ncbi:MAG: hypothetical protein IJT82_02640 [Schwartzia sp.]|nr:hypothetical protein [Schwartzia sp. (in: firmicutes)]
MSLLIYVLAVASGIIILLAAALKIFFVHEGNPLVVVCTKERTKFSVIGRDETSVRLSSRIEFKNIGKQCATIVDCVARPQLPFEQYDGIDARAKAEVDGIPREDDYFEATLINKHKSLFINIIVTLSARKNMSIEDAVSRMVDLPIDIICTQLGRRPWWMSKDRIILTSEELSAATGVKLLQD